MKILTDTDISKLAEAGRLIVENFSTQSVKQACYELRASNTYFSIQSGVSIRKEAEEYIIFPRQYVVIVTMEKLCLPANMLGRILAKGHLFSLGIIPVNTYADPGFSGYLGITLFNGSPDVIRIRRGQTIAKIEFNEISKPVSAPYQGQHGLSVGIWPVPAHLIVKPEELSAYGISPEDHVRIYEGEKVAQLSDELSFYTRWIWFQISVTCTVLLSLLYFVGEVSLFGAIITGVGSNLLTSFCGHLVRKWAPWKRWF